MNNNFYIYAHIRLDTNNVFYIGKGSGKRAWSEQSRNNYWHDIVSKYGYTPLLLEYFSDEQKAYQREEQLIMWHKFFGDCEANISMGGSGGSKGQPCLQETKEKISKTLTGSKIPIEIRLKISRSNRGKKRSDKTKQLMSIAFTGRKFKEGSGLNISQSRGCKPFSVYIALGKKPHWEKGNYIGTWINRSQCSRDLNIDSGCIGLCLSGDRKQHKGYIFESLSGLTL